MSRTAVEPKVLRVGIVREGKLVREQLIRPGEAIAEAPGLFVWARERWHLHVTPTTEGRIGADRAVSLRERAAAAPLLGDRRVIPLEPTDRGKVVLDGVVVLFQLVSGPPVPAAARRSDFRPRLVEQDDALLAASLCLFGAMGALFVVWAWTIELPETEVSAEEIAAIADGSWFEKIPVEPVEPDAQIAEARVPEPPPRVSVVRPSGPERRGPSGVEHADPGAAEREAAAAAALIIGEPTTRGEGVSDRFAPDALAQVGAANGGPASSFETVSEGTADLRPVGGGAGEATRGPRTGQIGVGGGTGLQDEPIALVVQPETGDTELLERGDGNVVADMVRRKSAQLKYCYEDRLNGDPDLSGRIELRWTMQDGRVSGVEIVANDTGDPELARCVADRVKQWPFAKDVSGEVVWPFTFSRSN